MTTVDAFWELARAAADGRFRFNRCLVAPQPPGTPYLDVDDTEDSGPSTSSSRVLFGRLANAGAGVGGGDAPVAVKVWFAGPGARCRATAPLEFEAAAYRYVTERAVLRGLTPALIPFLAAGECSFESFMVNARLSARARARFEKLRDDTFRTCAARTGDSERALPSVRMLATLSPCRKQPCRTLHDMYAEGDASTMAVLFVLTYTVDALARIGVQHNDLHPGNVVFPDPTPPTKALVFAVPSAASGVVRVPEDLRVLRQRDLPRMPFVFDWDRAYVADLPPNPNTVGPFCDAFGQCPRVDTSYDMFTLLYGAIANRWLLNLSGFLTLPEIDVKLDQDNRYESCRMDYGRELCGARGRLWSKYAHRERGFPLTPGTFPTAAELLRRPVFAERFAFKRVEPVFHLFAPPNVDRHRVLADIETYMRREPPPAPPPMPTSPVPAPISPLPREWSDPSPPRKRKLAPTTIDLVSP